MGTYSNENEDEAQSLNRPPIRPGARVFPSASLELPLAATLPNILTIFPDLR